MRPSRAGGHGGVPVLYATPWVWEATLTLLELRDRAQAREVEARRLDPCAIASDLLTAVRDGDDRAAEVAKDLAYAVLAAGTSRLARSVLEGGPLTITRAIRLAEEALSRPHRARRSGAS
jgi:hypothetical protein